jgi:hypothetical protein
MHRVDLFPRSTLRARQLWVMLAGVLSAACTEPAAPPSRQLAAIFDLETPAALSPVDSLRVGFSYVRGCTETAIEARLTPVAVEIAVWLEDSAVEALCKRMYVPLRGEILLLPSQRGLGPITVTYRQPDGVDSVRVVGVLGTTTPP